MNEPDTNSARPDLAVRLLHGVASVALVGMMLVVVLDVVLRHAFGTPVRGAYDLVGFALLVMVFFGMAPVIARGGEILIDLADGLLPEPALVALKLVAAVGSIVAFGFLGWSMLNPAREAWLYGDRSLELNLPVWIQWACAFVGLAGILWAAARRLVGLLRGEGGS